MENLITVGQILHRPIGQHLAHAGHESLPVVSPVKVIDHQKTALQQVLTQALGFRICEGPVGHLNGVYPGVVIDIVAVEIDHLLVGAHLDAGESFQGLEKLAIGLRIVP